MLNIIIYLIFCILALANSLSIASTFCPIIISPKINPLCENIILNLDDITNYYHKSKNLIDLITEMLPLLSRYKNIEFCMTENKLNQLIAPNINEIVLNKNIHIYHEARLRELQILSKKTNIHFSIVYVNDSNHYSNHDSTCDSNHYSVQDSAQDSTQDSNHYSTRDSTQDSTQDSILTPSAKNIIALDYYMSKMGTINNNKGKSTAVIKKFNHSILKPYWDLSTPIKIIKLKNNEVSMNKISKINYDTNNPHIKTIIEFFE